MEIKSDVPMTLVCSKAVEDIKDTLMGVMVEHEMTADLMCMVLRDCLSHFERLRADDYVNALIKQSAAIDALKAENDSLKKTTQLFNNVEGENDNSDDKS